MPRIPARINLGAGGGTQVRAATFPLERTGARATDDAQTKARAATAQASALPFGNGNLIAGVSMSASTALDVTHYLGRAAVGCFPVNIIGSSATKWVCQSLGTAQNGAVTVKIDQNAVVDWWVY